MNVTFVVIWNKPVELKIFCDLFLCEENVPLLKPLVFDLKDIFYHLKGGLHRRMCLWICSRSSYFVTCIRWEQKLCEILEKTSFNFDMKMPHLPNKLNVSNVSAVTGPILTKLYRYVSGMSNNITATTTWTITTTATATTITTTTIFIYYWPVFDQILKSDFWGQQQ